MHYLGIDIGGTTVKAGLVNAAGQLGETRRIPTIVTDLTAFVSTLTELISDFQKTASITAIGVGIPGLLNSTTRKIETSPNIPCLSNVSLEAILADQVHVPVISENDANCGAYAEAVCGAARGLRNMAYLTLGTGLGSGFVLNGKLYRGASGYAGEMGHTTIETDGRLCACGNHGCLEAYVSATGMVRTAHDLGAASFLTAGMIYDAAVEGDATARAVFEFTGRCLGVACANLMNLLNIEMIVLSGGVMASGTMMLNPAIDEARRRAFKPAFHDCPIVQSTLWPDGGLIGAAMLARDL
jgi:glucokinase